MMMTRMEQVKAGVSEGDDSFNNVQKVLTKYGMTLLDTAGQFKPLEDVIDELGQKWSTLDKFQQMQLVTAVAGARQANSMVALMDNYSNALSYQTEEANSAGLATQRYQTYQESLAASQAKFTDALNKMWSTTINQNFIKTIIDAGTAILNFIGDAGGLIPVLTTAIGLIVMLNAVQLSASIASWGKSIQSFVMVLKGVGTALETSLGWVGLILAAISLAVMAYDKWGNSVENAAKKVDAANQVLADTNTKLQNLKDQTNNIKDLSDQYEDLAKKTKLSADEQQNFTDIQNQLKDVLPTIAGYYDQTGNFIIDPSALISNQAYLNLLNDQITALETEQFLEAKSQSKVNANAYDANGSQTSYLASLNNGNSPIGTKSSPTDIKSINGNKISQDQIDANNAKIAANQATNDKMVQSDVDAYNDSTDAQKKSLKDQYANEGDYGKKVLSIIDGSATSTVTSVNNATSTIADHTVDDLKKITDASSQTESSVVTSFKSLQSALQDYNNEGSVSLTQAQSLIDAGYAQAVSINSVTGQVELNIPMLQQLAIEQINTALASENAAYAQLSLAEATGVAGKQILNEIDILNAQKSALAGSVVDTASLLATLSGITGVKLSSGGGASAVKDLNAAQKQAYQDQIDGINKEVDALNKQTTALNDQKKAYDDIISAQKQQLQLEKEKNDYEDELKTKNKELADIDNELIQIQYDDSEEGNAKRLQLEDQRAAKVTEINKTEADNTYSLQTEALDAEQAAYDKMIADQIAGINSVIDGYKSLISTIQDLITALGKVSSASGGSGGGSVPAVATKAVDKQSNYKPGPLGSNDVPSYYTNTSTGKNISSSAYKSLPAYAGGGIFETGDSSSGDSGLIRVDKNEIGVVLNRQQQIASAPLASLFSSIMKSTGTSSPQFSNNAGGNGNVTMGDMIVNVTGSLDKTVLPDLKELIMKTQMEALRRAGIVRNASSFTT